MSNRKESANRIMVSEVVELLHIVQERDTRVVIHRHLCEADDDYHSYRLESLEGGTWNPVTSIDDWQLEAVLALFKTAQQLLLSPRGS
jgi:hypothetical protein